MRPLRLPVRRRLCWTALGLPPCPCWSPHTASWVSPHWWELGLSSPNFIALSGWHLWVVLVYIHHRSPCRAEEGAVPPPVSFPLKPVSPTVPWGCAGLGASHVEVVTAIQSGSGCDECHNPTGSVRAKGTCSTHHKEAVHL